MAKSKRFTDAKLVNIIFDLTHLLTGVKLFPYQEQPAKRIIRSVLLNDGDELTNIQTRQSGKSETVSYTVSGLLVILPTLANLPMFIDDERLKPYRDGIMIGVFAPALQQSQIIYNRVRKRLGSKQAQEFMYDPSVNVSMEVSNGENVSLSNGSTMSAVSASIGSNIEGRSYHLIIVDEAQDVNDRKYNKSISPMGAFYNATKVLIGTPTFQKGFFFYSIERNKIAYENKTGRRNHFEYSWHEVVKYNDKYAKYIEGEKARLGEESDEFQMSYNLQWRLERGMFITARELEKNLDPEREVVMSDLKKSHILGIDLARTSDSTVLTFVEVDYDDPVIIEESSNMGVSDYVAYRTIIKKWVEIQGTDYENQYYRILEELRYFNVKRIVLDSTSVGTPIADRLIANLDDIEIVPFDFSRSSKSMLYKHYETELKSGRVIIPAGEMTGETREFNKFVNQHTALNKEYAGQYLVVKHPDVAGARDDYADSSALAVFGARGEDVARPTVEDNVFAIDQLNSESYYRSRNSVTARRR